MGLELQCECGSRDIISDAFTGEQICRRCGTVLSTKIIDQGPEWRAFNQEQVESLSRTGAPLTSLIYDKGLSTTISWRSRDATGRRLTAEEQHRQYRLRKWQQRTSAKDGAQRNLVHALGELTRIADELSLPQNTRETAAVIYRRAVSKGFMRGRTIQSVIASALYMACRQCHVIRSLDEVANAATVSRKEAARGYRFLYKHLEPKVPPVNRNSLISKYVSNLNVSGQTEQLCRAIMHRASEKRLTVGRAPEGITAAALYLACKLNQEYRTQGEIAKAAQITEVTIRNRYKELLNEFLFEVAL